MKTRAEIKDQIASEFGYADYKEAKKKAYISKDLEAAMDRIIDLCCTECVKEHLSRAAENATRFRDLEDENTRDLYESITNIDIILP